ncbi:serine/threonine protein kinase [Hyalangium minutum]|uniref:Serine/threonine protein kinase n=1 Tax=Hyalangium minutum TaxID=394096 RepID=A0A085WX16_9BACT|nr:serine/threonine protein kinase [Hyalangium minutum]KFE72229.1 Serine/threonine protein kinase [Hyalangium minutum]
MRTLLRLPSGLFIDGWHVLKELGNGGFAVVYLAEKNGKRCALKVARHRQASGDEKQTHARAKRELTVLSMLDHPNIVALCGHGYAEAGNFYLALEYVDGWTLDEWKERKHPTFHEILRVFVKIAAALAYMHSRGILHRDLKLVNVLIRKSDGEPIIIDFGCATYEQAADLTESGLPPGTDRFRAPEQFKYLREHREEHRAKYAFQVADEIFAVGAMIYELLTDPRPTEERPRETLNSPFDPPPPPRARNPRVPEALSDLVESMLSRDPASRPVDTDALHRELAELEAHPGADYQALAHLPSEQRRPEQPNVSEPVEQHAGRWGKLRALGGRVGAVVRRSGNVLAASAIAAVVLGVAVALWFRPQTPESVAEPIVATSPTPPTAAPDMSPLAPAPMVGTVPTPAPVSEEGSTVKTPPPEDPKEARRQKTSSGSDMRKVVPIVCSLAAGCTGVPVKPDAFTCPEGSQRAMEELHWTGREQFSLVLDDRHDEDADIWLRPGDTVVGIVPKGVTPSQAKLAPPGTQFLGGKVYVWPEKTASGRPGRVVVKYERVKLPRQDEVPVCFVVDVGALELKDGNAKTANGTAGFIERYWRP